MKNKFLLFIAVSVLLFSFSLTSTLGFSIGEKTFNRIKSPNSRKYFSIPITISPEGHIFIKAKINGVEGRFILDTGAGINVITKKFASKLNDVIPLDGTFTGFRATGEKLNMKLFSVKNIEIGNLIIHNNILTILYADFGKFDGLISMTCFRNQPFTIDFPNKKIYLETKKSLNVRMKKGKIVPIQLDDDRGISLDLFTKVKVNNKLILQISLDSGAGFDVFRFNAGFMNKLGIDSSNAKKYSKKSSINKEISNAFYISNVKDIFLYSAPSVHDENVKASFLKGLIYDGITCINWLGKQVTIDIPDKEMILN